MTYAGARGRMTWDDARRLGSDYVIQPKMDGIYVEVETDERGRVVAVRSRSGRCVGEPARDILGARIAPCMATFAGELEAYTEAGRAAATEAGFAKVHLFDVLNYHPGPDALQGGDLGVPAAIARAPYRARREALYRLQSSIATPENLDGHRCPREHLWRRSDGTYRRGPADWRVAPIVPQVSPSRAADLWERAMSDVLEGLVVVALNAPLGARRSKRKVKRTDTLDCIVLETTAKRCTVGVSQLFGRGGMTFGRVFSVGCQGLCLVKGDVIEVCYNGEYRDGTPRFPRIKRRRDEIRPRVDGREARGASSCPVSDAC